jgi:hypothetical protein
VTAAPAGHSDKIAEAKVGDPRSVERHHTRRFWHGVAFLFCSYYGNATISIGQASRLPVLAASPHPLGVTSFNFK